MKHADLIHMALDGAVIQALRPSYLSEWESFSTTRDAVMHMAKEHSEWQYRIEPPKPGISVRYGRANTLFLDNATVTYTAWTLVKSVDANLKLTFTGGELTGAEIIKK